MASIIINGLAPEEVATLEAKAKAAGTSLDGEGSPVWATFFKLPELLASPEAVQDSETETHEEVTP